MKNYTLKDPDKNSNKDFLISEEKYNALSQDDQALYESEDDEDWDPDEDLDDDNHDIDI